MTSPMSNLLERRVPQWTAVYLGAGWGLVQFIAFMEERYLISPHWTDLCLMLLGLLLPSVILYTYNHGRPGADEFKRSEKVGIPVNVAVAALVVWLVFGGRDLGAMTTEITVTGANGETIERSLAKPEHRRRLAVFTPETSGDTAWAGEAALIGMVADLSQDSWLDLRGGPHFTQELRERGFEHRETVPLALKREISRDMNLTHFLVTRIVEAPGGYRMSIGVYDVGRGSAVGEHSYTGGDILALVDSASLDVRRDLELPSGHIDEVEDMPVSERLTSETGALRSYARGQRALLDNDWPSAAGFLTQAVEADSTFAMAALELFQARLLTSDASGAAGALALATEHMYRFPERMQYTVRAIQYQMQREHARAIGVLEVAAQLYPDDTQTRMSLAQLYQLVDRERDAIRMLEEVLRLDPAQVEHLLAIGTLHRELGEPDSALAAYERYTRAAPNKADGPRTIGELHAERGEHAAARAQYERALLLAPGDVDVLARLGALARETGDFAEAERQLQAALGAARSPAARFTALDAQADLALWRGRPSDGYAVLQRANEQAAQFQPPLVVTMLRLYGLRALSEAGRGEEARRELAAVSPMLTGIYADMSALGTLVIEVGAADPDPARIDAAATRLEALIQSMGWEMIRPAVHSARGLAAETRGEHAQALTHYRRRLEVDPTAIAVHTDIGRVLRLQGDLVGAAREIAIALERRPSDARARYELALVHEAAGRSSEAVSELRKALESWSDAEPGFRPAARAREALDRLLAVRPSAG